MSGPAIRATPGRSAEPAPVVVWSHGGSQGRRDPRSVGVRWGRAFGNAEAAFVAIAHPGRSVAERIAVCAVVGATDAVQLFRVGPFE